jgi:hypothetical protein
MKKSFFLVGMIFMLLSCDLIDLSDDDCTRLIANWCLNPFDRSSCGTRITFKSDGTVDGALVFGEEYYTDCSKIDFYTTFLNQRVKVNTWIIISLTPDELVVQTDEFDNNSRLTFWRWR